MSTNALILVLGLAALLVVFFLGLAWIFGRPDRGLPNLGAQMPRADHDPIQPVMALINEIQSFRRPVARPTTRERIKMSRNELEIARFFLALKKSLESKTQLLPYLRAQIVKGVEENYLTLSDKEVQEYLDKK